MVQQYDPQYTDEQVHEQLRTIARLARQYQKKRSIIVRYDLFDALDKLYGSKGQRATKTRHGSGINKDKYNAKYNN